MTLWMLWSILLAAIVGIAALSLERAATAFGAQRRHIWSAALVVSVFIPALLALRRNEVTQVVNVVAPTAEGALPADPDIADVAKSLGLSLDGSARATRPASRGVAFSGASLNSVVIFLWIAASCALAFAFGRSMLQLHRMRKAWTNARVGNHQVLLSAEDGPAVIGFTQPRIVFPRWALALDAQSQEMMLRHESEHIRSGDPRVLLAAGLALIALPWNAGIWWLVRRLRMAMELDCDARVIKSVGTSHEYGMMLLEVCERRPTCLPLASALTSTRPLLERRIDAMSLPRPRRPMRAALPFFIVALVATTAAASAPRPASMRAPIIRLQQQPPSKAIVAAPAPARSPATAAAPSTNPPLRAPSASIAASATRSTPGSAVAAAPAMRAPSGAEPAAAARPSSSAPTFARAVEAAPTRRPPLSTATPRNAPAATAVPVSSAPSVAGAPASPPHGVAPASAIAAPATGAPPAVASPAISGAQVPGAPPAAIAIPARKAKPDRAKIAALAKQYLQPLVRGDTTADYAVIVLDANGRYVWSTHGQGALAIAVTGDTRTAAQRRDYNRENIQELVGVNMPTGAVGAVGGGGFGAGSGSGARLISVRDTGRRVAFASSDSANVLARRVDAPPAVMSVGASGGAGGRVVSSAGDTALLTRRLDFARDTFGNARVVGRFNARDSASGIVGSGVLGGANTIRASGAGGAAGGGGRGGSGFGGTNNNADSSATSTIYTTQVLSPRTGALNTASGLQELGNGQSGIQGVLSASIASTDTYLFRPQELTQNTIRVVVVNLTPGTRWGQRF